VNSERAQYWLSVGAQPTEAVVALFKRSGDWQKFSGDTSPSGVEPQKEKRNKLDAFNSALAEAGSEPQTAAISKRSDKSKDDQPADDAAESAGETPAAAETTEQA
jgi:small subunit ribosomal protein S16